MEDLFPAKLLDLLVISITLSVIVMVILQKFKSLPFIKKTWQIWIFTQRLFEESQKFAVSGNAPAR